jgi:hypothetical protein
MIQLESGGLLVGAPPFPPFFSGIYDIPCVVHYHYSMEKNHKLIIINGTWNIVNKCASSLNIVNQWYMEY